MGEKYLSTVIYVSIVILVYQGIADSNLGIVSQLTHQNGNNWAGPLNTTLFFLASGSASLYNKYIGKFQFRYCFFVGSFGCTIFISMGLIFLKLGFSTTVLVFIFVGSFIAGIGSSIFYNTQFNFINTLSKIDNRQIKYFGINLASAQSSSIFGNVVSSLLIKPLGQFNSVLVMLTIQFCASLFFLRLKDPDQFTLKLLEEPEQQQNQSVKLQKKQKEQKSVSIQQSKWPPLTVCFCFAFTGLVISFIYSFLSIILYRTFEQKMQQTQLNQLTFVLFIFEGIGESLGGIFMITFSKRIKDYAKCFMISSTLFIVSVVIIFIGSSLQNIYIIGFGVVLAGFSDCSGYVSSLSLSGTWKQKGVSAFNVSQCALLSTTVMFNVFVPFTASMIWIGVFYIINTVGLFLFRRSKQCKVQQLAQQLAK